MTTIDNIVDAVFELIPEQYAEGWSTSRLRKQWGLGEGKVIGLVKRAGVYEPGRRPGPVLGSVCSEGHDQSVHRKQRKNGSFFCGECKRRRDREADARKRQREKGAA